MRTYVYIHVYIEYSFFHLRVIERHRAFSFRGIDLMLTIKKLWHDWEKDLKDSSGFISIFVASHLPLKRRGYQRTRR